MFGPFVIRQKRSETKRYGAMLTYMNSRIMHIEITHTLGTDSFKMALMRFITRRGNVQTILKKNQFLSVRKSADKSIRENVQPKSSSIYASI